MCCLAFSFKGIHASEENYFSASESIHFEWLQQNAVKIMATQNAASVPPPELQSSAGTTDSQNPE